MKTKLALGAVAAAIAVFSQGAFSQASSPTRAEVKAQARTAVKAPAGEAPTGGTPASGSMTTRAERKATTKAALKAGDAQPMGEASNKEGKTAPAAGSTTTRAERKETTKAAIKAGDVPKGEATAASGPGSLPKK